MLLFTLKFITIFIIYGLFLNDLIKYIEYGGFIKKDDSDLYIKDLNLYQICGDVLCVDKSYFYIYKCNTFISGYKIDGLGMIPRFSKLHFKIKKRFKELESQNK